MSVWKIGFWWGGIIKSLNTRSLGPGSFWCCTKRYEYIKINRLYMPIITVYIYMTRIFSCIDSNYGISCPTNRHSTLDPSEFLYTELPKVFWNWKPLLRFQAFLWVHSGPQLHSSHHRQGGRHHPSIAREVWCTFASIESKNWTYCWWTKSCTTKDDDYPIIYRVLTIPGGAGFLPSTVAVWISGWIVICGEVPEPQEFGELISGMLLSFYMPLGMRFCPQCLRFQSFWNRRACSEHCEQGFQNCGWKPYSFMTLKLGMYYKSPGCDSKIHPTKNPTGFAVMLVAPYDLGRNIWWKISSGPS